jgi:hypothetical protein
MAVYRFWGKKGACALVAGDVNKHEDWRDGAGAAARFSRQHQMAAFRTNELLLTDIDNRAVRRITLADGRASTVPYDDGGHLYTELWGDRFPAAHATPVPAAARVLPEAHAKTTSATAAAAAADCAARGAALCPPAALRDDKVLGRLRRSAAWTSQSCHSCWLHWPGVCPVPKAHKQANKRTSAAWGNGYQMVARVGAGDDVRFECTDVKKAVGTKPLCCTAA